jgi:hypothetical protein
MQRKEEGKTDETRTGSRETTKEKTQKLNKIIRVQNT